MNTIFLGIFPPPIANVLLPIVIAGIIGFLLCYAHRFLVFVVLPVFMAFFIYLINFLEFFTDLLSSYMLVVYSAMFFSAGVILTGTRLSWKKYHAEFSKLK